MRPVSRTARLLRALTALITVWCVGCSGFEPLLDAAFGAGSSVMTCGSGGASMGTEMSPSSTGPTRAQATVSPVADAHHAFDCGCGSCHSVAPHAWALPSMPSVSPAVMFGHVGALVSVARAPLLPPPQYTA
jgi:hypothetical protein